MSAEVLCIEVCLDLWEKTAEVYLITALLFGSIIMDKVW